MSVFLAHGSIFLSLRTKGEVQERASALARRVVPVAAVITVAFLVWTCADQSFGAGVVIPAVLAVAAYALVPALLMRSPGRAFVASSLAIVLFVVTLCASLWPNAIPSTTSSAFNLTLHAASSTSYTLTVMTVVAIIFVPIVLAYQAWTYWVFRHRLGRDDFEGPMTPVAVLEHRAQTRGRDGHHGPTTPEPTAGPAAGA